MALYEEHTFTKVFCTLLNISECSICYVLMLLLIQCNSLGPKSVVGRMVDSAPHFKNEASLPSVVNNTTSGPKCFLNNVVKCDM